MFAFFNFKAQASNVQTPVAKKSTSTVSQSTVSIVSFI